MMGYRTGIVLGAGASYCYEDGAFNIPIQADIIGKLFFEASVSSGEGFPSFSDPNGLRHSFELGQFLRTRYDISCVFHGILPPNPQESCHSVHVKVAMQSMPKLPPNP